MQSVSAYSRVSAARGLTLNLTTECCSKSKLSITNAASIINNRIFNRLFSNLRFLSENLSYQKRITGSVQHQQSQQIFNIANSSDVSSTSSSFLFSNLLQTKPLRLVTAYSGYSNEFIHNKKKGMNNAMQYLNRKRGVIGDDAWFIASKNSTDVLGVADGVGGWRDIGVDPSKFSSYLMQTCKRIVEQGINLEEGNLTFFNFNNKYLKLKSN